jgi:hypothetical protein
VDDQFLRMYKPIRRDCTITDTWLQLVCCVGFTFALTLYTVIFCPHRSSWTDQARDMSLSSRKLFQHLRKITK